MSHLIWIYAVCKSLLVSPVAVKELRSEPALIFIAPDKVLFFFHLISIKFFLFLLCPLVLYLGQKCLLKSVFFFFFFFLQ